MPLVDVEIPVETSPLPDEVVAFLNEADQRIDQFIARRLDNPVPGFVPADYPLIFQLLQTCRNVHLATGNRFCEWGSGFGVIASMAAMLGFEAYGIEIESELVTGAEQLAEDFDVEGVEFVRGSFIPEGGEAFADRLGNFHLLDTVGESAYDELELEPDDFDMIFVYPWPGEEDVVTGLFERYAAVGSILLTHHGTEGSRIRRKSTRRARRK